MIKFFPLIAGADKIVLTTQPRNNPDPPVTGAYSTRSPDRPDPIGIHFVTIDSVPEENKFKVSGLEILDGTPVIDIKPDLNRKDLRINGIAALCKFS